MSVQTLTPGTPASVSGPFRFEVRANVDLANRCKLTLRNQGVETILGDVRDGNSRIGDAVAAAAGATVLLETLTGSGGSARVFDGADRKTFPDSGSGAPVLP